MAYIYVERERERERRNPDLHLLLDGIGGARFENGVSRTPTKVFYFLFLFVNFFCIFFNFFLQIFFCLFLCTPTRYVWRTRRVSAWIVSIVSVIFFGLLQECIMP
jgi:hypothetical protein